MTTEFTTIYGEVVAAWRVAVAPSDVCEQPQSVTVTQFTSGVVIIESDDENLLLEVQPPRRSLDF